MIIHCTIIHCMIIHITIVHNMINLHIIIMLMYYYVNVPLRQEFEGCPMIVTTTTTTTTLITLMTLTIKMIWILINILIELNYYQEIMKILLSMTNYNYYNHYQKKKILISSNNEADNIYNDNICNDNNNNNNDNNENNNNNDDNDNNDRIYNNDNDNDNEMNLIKEKEIINSGNPDTNKASNGSDPCEATDTEGTNNNFRKETEAKESEGGKEKGREQEEKESSSLGEIEIIEESNKNNNSEEDDDRNNNSKEKGKQKGFFSSEGQDNSIRMLYEYYQITCPKDDTAMDQFCGSVDRYGFVLSEDDNDSIPELSQEEIRYEKKDIRRSQKWAEWVNAKKFVKKSGKFGISSFVFPWNTKFQNRIYKGVPDPWRQPVWHFLLTNGSSETDLDEPSIRNYKELLTRPSPHERQIDLDIPRSLHSHIMFRTRYGPGQRSLFNILRAFSNYDTQVGYCQGMTSIVTILLMYYTEENAFVMLTKLFGRCDLHNLYVPGFPALLESFYVQEKLMELNTPKIAEKFNELQISNTAYATKWYITLFTSDVVPHHTMLRIWDLMMLYGFDVLYFVAVALLKYYEDVLLSSSFEQIMLTLSSPLAIDDDDKLMKKVHKLYEKKGRKQLIDTFKAEYRNQAQ
ncbi:hypothetical protein Glove_606g60 [Diversispora epigaea]|uniref:Rab-GAP TBC domain-containing protein n=1 Tax=Diversispora epigaea TaxID=1348612 RepID=A0A397GFC7_9GLOM|nr:hypothetical protein Glove_606g60 [Diversispora epigaea]